jgi:hypothetical protein
MAAATPEQAQTGMDAWMEWAERNRDAIVELGTPLGGDSDVSGYSIVQAESRDAAAELFKDHPHLRMPGDSSIELLEFLPLPGS